MARLESRCFFLFSPSICSGRSFKLLFIHSPQHVIQWRLQSFVVYDSVTWKVSWIVFCRFPKFVLHSFKGFFNGVREFFLLLHPDFVSNFLYYTSYCSHLLTVFGIMLSCMPTKIFICFYHYLTTFFDLLVTFV